MAQITSSLSTRAQRYCVQLTLLAQASKHLFDLTPTISLSSTINPISTKPPPHLHHQRLSTTRINPTPKTWPPTPVRETPSPLTPTLLLPPPPIQRPPPKQLKIPAPIMHPPSTSKPTPPAATGRRQWNVFSTRNPPSNQHCCFDPILGNCRPPEIALAERRTEGRGR
ncbi:hypothetical protein BDZ45DRAFT_748916 [Acephala macrosclerotiorum]|nr:hypothetical protein BDZ45DRAFT_748916 [Acephala macrosclerotiorum]